MKLKTIFGILLLSGAALLTDVSTTSAYFTTNQSSHDLGQGKALFTITYSFGFADREVYLPLTASRNTASRPDMSYALIQSSTTTDAGKATGLVLSKAQIKNGQYYVPAGQKADFTFISLVDMSNLKMKSASTSVLVTSLPFTMISSGSHVPAQLNPSELQYYRTPELTLP